MLFPSFYTSESGFTDPNECGSDRIRIHLTGGLSWLNSCKSVSLVYLNKNCQGVYFYWSHSMFLFIYSHISAIKFYRSLRYLTRWKPWINWSLSCLLKNTSPRVTGPLRPPSKPQRHTCPPIIPGPSLVCMCSQREPYWQLRYPWSRLKQSRNLLKTSSQTSKGMLSTHFKSTAPLWISLSFA